MTPIKLLLLIFTAQTFVATILCTEIDEYEEESLKHSLPAYAIIAGANHLNSTTCKRELDELHKAINERHLWSLRVLDSSGEPKSGFLYGNNYWMGSRSQCQNIGNRIPLELSFKELLNNSKYRNYEDEFPPFDLNFYVAYIRHNSTLQYHVTIPVEDIITFGVCLPDSCTKYELSIIIKNVLKNRTLLFSDLYLAGLELIDLKDLKDDHDWLVNGPFIILCLIVLVTLLLIIVGTFYDFCILRKRTKKHKKFHSCENNNMSLQIDTKQSEEDTEEQQVNLISESTWGQVFKAFSLYTNTKIVCNMSLQDDAVPCVHGLRFFGMLWIISLHTIFYMNDVTDNKPVAWRIGQSLPGQIVSNATMAVDTFFVMTGFLMTYMFLISKEVKDVKEGRRSLNYWSQFQAFLISVFKRFMRLTPAYMVTLLIFEINTRWYTHTSLFFISERGDTLCSKYWWRNLLYIQNLFSRETMCMSWGWYVANDMQFFAFGTIILMLSLLYFKTIAIVTSLILLVSMILTGYVSYVNEYVPTVDQQFHLLHALYDPPWTRIGPYIVGIFAGYLYVKIDKKLPLKRSTVIMLWILGSCCNTVILFGLVKRQISILAAAVYSAFNRVGWGIGIAWIIIACCTRHGGVVNRILSFRGWIPFSRLTYCVYLLNPILITSVYLHGETAIRIDIVRTVTTFLGHTIINYVCAFFFTMMFETPYTILTKQIINYLKRKK